MALVTILLWGLGHLFYFYFAHKPSDHVINSEAIIHVCNLENLICITEIWFINMIASNFLVTSLYSTVNE